MIVDRAVIIVGGVLGRYMRLTGARSDILGLYTTAADHWWLTRAPGLTLNSTEVDQK